MFDTFINKNKLGEAFRATALAEFIPLAEKIVAKQSLQNSPFFIGVNGCQGSGKSTLSDFLCEYIKERYKLNVIVLSLDDFYYSRQKRAELAATIHPLLATRGVPGTQDTRAIALLLEQLKQRKGRLLLPRFNKAIDDPFSEENLPMVRLPVDIVLFEGWCWGVYPQSERQLERPINELEREQDVNSVWRGYVNQCLKNDYVPLYAYMNFWVFLKPPSFVCVYQWRLEQENKLRLKSDIDETNKLMSEKELMVFIKFYQRLTEHSLASMEKYCDVIFFLDNKRNIIKTLIQ